MKAARQQQLGNQMHNSDTFLWYKSWKTPKFLTLISENVPEKLFERHNPKSQQVGEH